MLRVSTGANRQAPAFSGGHLGGHILDSIYRTKVTKPTFDLRLHFDKRNPYMNFGRN